MRVFICHSSDDKAAVRELEQRLRSDGLDTWLDEDQLLPGHDWHDAILDALRMSDAVLVCLSANAVNKTGYLQKEIRLALDAADERPHGRTFLVPVRLDECVVPRPLRRWQSVDLFRAGAYERLVAALLGNGAQSAGTRELSPPPTSSGKRYLVPAIVTALLIFAGATFAIYYRQAPAEHVGKAVPDGMVRVVGGRFLMGRDDSDDAHERPAHFVVVSSFAMDIHPVTNDEYLQAVRAGRVPALPHLAEIGVDQDRRRWPVTGISWGEASQYCESRGRRLPTEAEWEYAARGLEGRLYPWGNDFSPHLVNSLEAGTEHPEPVGHRPNKSPAGVLDMAGNVWQWVQDDFRPYSNVQPGPVIPAGAKVIRGGSFRSDKWHVMTTTRNFEIAGRRSPVIGFRCAASL